MFSLKSRFFKLAAAIILVFAVIPVNIFAEADDWYMNKVISDVTFEGLSSVKKSELNGITQKYIGRAFTDDLYSELYDRIEALTYFESIEPFAKHDPRNAEKVVLVFTVKEYPVISEIEFKGNKKIRNNELRDTISIKTGDVYVEANTLIDVRALRDLYISKGFSGAKVTSSTETTDHGIKVTFTVSEGANTVITSIKFMGNSVCSEKTLKTKISLKEVGFLKDGAFQKSSLEADKGAIIQYYMTRGYIDAVILDVIQENNYNPEKDRDEITITFILSEGAQYTYNGMEILGNEIFTKERLLSNIKLNVGDVFNQTKFQEGLSNLTNVYYENGYMTTEFHPNINKDGERKTVAYTLRITERSRAHVENIIIKGNTKTKDEVILRELPIQPGDVFSRDKIIAGMRNLYNTQFFSSIVPEPVSGSEENLVDLVLTVEEQSTTSLQFGMTFSGIEEEGDLPISLFLKWQNSNFRGEGKSISAGLNIATKEQSVDLSYAQNWLFGMPVSFSESLSFSHSQDSAIALNFLGSGIIDESFYYMTYESWSTTLGTSFGRRWTPNWAIITINGGMANTLSDNIYEESLYTTLDSGVNKSANRFGLKDSLFANISLDNRDVNYDPSKGWFVSQRIAWYGLIPVVEKEFYFRTDTKLEGYVTLFDIPCFNGFWNFKGILAGYAGLSMVFPVPGTLFSSSSQVYIDGMFNGRGWNNISSKARGKSMLSLRGEYRMPIVTGMLGLDIFADAVAVKPTVEDLFTNLNVNDFYFSFGPGIRFLMPQFPLHLIFANKFKFENNNPVWVETMKFVLSFNITNR